MAQRAPDYTTSFLKKDSPLLILGFKIYNLLVENFPRTYFVGGTVRDFLLKKTTKDIDIATSAKPL